MKKTLVIFALLFLVLPQLALAQTNPCTLAGVKSSTDKSSTLPACINQIYVWSLGVGGLLALLMVIFGGYMYMTAAGNAEQASKGVEMLWGAIIGLALLFGAYLLLRTINPDLVNFNIGSVQNLNQQPSGPRQ
ncbi:MAG: hypothetical protein A3B10_04485 [Candidatus Doudnabacteria bacterium RIFCSPLOWO2_01_FULL_44_21]|uniref:DUF4134 domain-containing protein n=1 Tax=Candidatus Doudnabacteria bacterium RIFCSPLOWO2_01_FULL_44_21 TaxID=1817841 RepID=A0A1F5PXS4_9BACT|nr:MAG: hypothetical protein A3B95_01460 [Candidatus Doudnabacteria bacterium RIFCSPHIGHO2_02_FULL_43_13b]OGE94738.1 MAG: hypothetical protein A3B10_04485 [Candidatus Doudnabacteria bacterium RIFCSPLOWO2_01_FULL_44_21]